MRPPRVRRGLGGLVLALGLALPAQAAAPSEALHELTWYVHTDLVDAGAGMGLSFWQQFIEANLAQANDLLQGYHGPADTACPTALSAVSVSEFGSPGDGLDVISSQADLDAVLQTAPPGAYLVESVWFCGGFSMQIRGCALNPGDHLVVAREGDAGNFMPPLIAHERGHNTGLGHVAANPCQLMAASNGGGCIDTAECQSFVDDADSSGDPLVCLGPDVGDPRTPDGSLCGSLGSCELCWGGLCGDCNSPASTSLVASGGSENPASGVADDAILGLGTTGGWDELGPIEAGMSTEVTGMAWAAGRGQLFGVAPGAGNDELLELDPDTGMKLGVVGTLDRVNLISLAYDPGSDRLLAIATDSFCAPDNVAVACDGPLIAIDPDDASVSEIGDPSLIVPAGYQGLTFIEATSTLYASAASGVYSMDTGASCNFPSFCTTTKIFPDALAPSSLAFDERSGLLVRIGRQLGSGSTVIERIDPASGALVGRLGIDGFRPGGLAAVCADIDGDGVCNVEDNCVAVSNPDQIDAEPDGFGNRCDGDYDDTGAVGSGDFIRLRHAFGTLMGDPDYDPAVDFDGNNAIGSGDFVFFRSVFGSSPGPSGLACAGSIPCTAN